MQKILAIFAIFLIAILVTPSLANALPSISESVGVTDSLTTTTTHGITSVPVIIKVSTGPDMSDYFFANWQNNSTTVGAENYNQVQNNVHALKLITNMERNATAYQQSQMYANAHSLKEYMQSHPYQTIDSLAQLTKDKREQATATTITPAKYYMTNYDYSVQDSKRQILVALKSFRQESSIPAFTTCQAWHDCKSKVFLPQVSDAMAHEVGNSTITGEQIHTTIGNHTAKMKPEFALNPTGYINATTWIKNYADLQKFMTAHK